MTSVPFTLRGLVLAGLLSWPLTAGEVEASSHDDRDNAHASVADSRCLGLTESWFEPWHHQHFRNGAPLIHNFGFEPAFLGRDLFVDYLYAALDEGDEHEVAVELEWALTKRIGLVVEQGYVFAKPAGGPDVDGWADFAVVPRFVLVDCERCFLSANLEIVAPTGSTEIGGGEEWRLAPFINTWCDLGDWWSLTTQTGVEFALESEESEFFFAVGVSKSFRVFDAPAQRDSDGHIHGLPTGILSVIGEVSGSAVIDGDPAEEGVFSLEGLIGLSLGVASGIDVRAGYLFPLNAHSELDGGAILGVIHHF